MGTFRAVGDCRKLDVLIVFDIAMPDKVYMPFVENCDYIEPLLEELQLQGSYREDISRILELFETYNKQLVILGRSILKRASLFLLKGKWR